MHLRLAAAALAVLLLALGAGSVLAATPGTAPGQNKLLCFDGGGGAGGTCTLNANGAKGTAKLNTSTGGAAGVYYTGYNASIYDVLLTKVTQLSFTVSGSSMATDPHFSVPIDTGNDDVTDFWAFVPAGSCNNGQGKVDVIGDSTCTIYRSDDALASYANWKAFAAALPSTAVVSFGDYVFVIADSSNGIWTVGNVTIGKSGK